VKHRARQVEHPNLGRREAARQQVGRPVDQARCANPEMPGGAVPGQRLPQRLGRGVAPELRRQRCRRRGAQHGIERGQPARGVGFTAGHAHA
jgi:hypothetical protein